MGVRSSSLADVIAKDLGLGRCLEILWALPSRQRSSSESTESKRSSSEWARNGAAAPQRLLCGGCGRAVEEFALGPRGQQLCRVCLRHEDETLLGELTEEERGGLDLLADVLDTVSWKYWKPGEQPAKILDWLYLGDLKESTDFDLLASRGISAVLSLINWWELSARLPEVADVSALYSSHGIEFEEADAEDRLFFNIVGKCWPKAEAFLESCRDRGVRVMVNCKAGHNRAVCICVCWLLARQDKTLVEAVDQVQRCRGAILSNHGFRLQLVRLALQLGRLGESTSRVPLSMPIERLVSPGTALEEPTRFKRLVSIIKEKRMTVLYDFDSMEADRSVPLARFHSGTRATSSLISEVMSEEAQGRLNQRTLKMELLACLYHHGRKFLSDYEYTSSVPTVVGSGFSGDVVLCKRREKAAVRQNKETSVRCVKTFDLQQMGPDKREKLKNEVAIYLSLEHPHIARLFDAYEDAEEVSLVMQYCSGGTLENALKTRGAFSERDFQSVAVPMLLAVNYIHRAGIVHRDIKPRNWVYEADGATIKLIDFGFSVKSYLGKEGDLRGCMGTLGYLAPEVVQAGMSTDTAYTEKCDIWSLGAVFLELLTGEPAFHRDAGECDGYTEEVVLREIKEVTEEATEKLLIPVPRRATPLLRRMLTKGPTSRPSAWQVLEDPYLLVARSGLSRPARALPMRTILERFRAHAQASTTSRAWLLAVARSPTHLPWEDFCALRDTFKMFDAHGLNGTVSLDTFIAVAGALPSPVDSPREGNYLDKYPSHGSDEYHSPTHAADEEQIRKMWRAICGEQESLSYCEFLAALLPPIEDVFQDADPSMTPAAVSTYAALTSSTPRAPLEGGSPTFALDCQWNPSNPVSLFLGILQASSHPVTTFDEGTPVSEVVAGMMRGHHRWVIVRYQSGKHEFFDYMDINHKLLALAGQNGQTASQSLECLCSMEVGQLANCSGHSLYRPATEDTPLREVLRLISGRSGRQGRGTVRRVPIVNCRGEIVSVFSCLSFLCLAMRFRGPTAALKSLAAKAFDRRSTILQLSALHDEPMLHALRIMDTEQLTICPTTSRELSGDMGGVVASNVVSVADLKWIMRLRNFDALSMSVSDFVAWRRTTADKASLGQILRQQRLSRFNVVSVHEGASLHLLTQRLLASKLQRIFLSSDEIARIVGIVSSRDILLAVLDQIL